MSKCKDQKCGAIFYWIINPKNGKHIPVDEDSLFESEVQDIKGGHKIALDPSRHISHFKTCKSPDQFSKNKQQTKTYNIHSPKTQISNYSGNKLAEEGGKLF